MRAFLQPVPVLAWFLAPWGLALAEPDAPPAEPQGPVETVEVQGATDRLSPRDPSAFATVIRAEDFEGRITSISELLREAVGVQVQSLGGSFATVSIRGSSAEQVVVYLDGVPLNRALGGATNLSELPLGQVESIEIYRGTTPASLPSASIGGAIMINTRRASAGQNASASIAFGSFNTSEATGYLSRGGDRASWSLGFDAITSDGNFLYLDNNGTTNETRDDALTRRTNNDRRRFHLIGNASFKVGSASRIEFTTDVLGGEQGVPGFDAIQTEQARFDSSRVLMRGSVETPGLAGGRLLLRGALDYSRYQESLDSTGEDIFFYPTRSDTRIASFGQEAGGVIVASAHQAISFLASHRRETADLDDDHPDSFDRGVASRDQSVLTIEDQISLSSDRLVISPSIRYERWSSRFSPGVEASVTPEGLDGADSDTNGKIGILWRINGALTLKTNAATFLRLPDFIEMFGNSGSVLGNALLRPESGRVLDIGIAAERTRAGPLLRSAGTELSLFETVADDLIIFVPNSQNSVIARNIGRARIRGVEWSLSLALGPRFTGSVNATHQEAIDESGGPADGNILPGRPENEVTARAGLRLGSGNLYYTFTYVGMNYINPQNIESDAIPARYLHDIGYRFSPSRGFQVVVEIRNIGDDRHFDVARYPLPGRSVHGRLMWDF